MLTVLIAKRITIFIAYGRFTFFGNLSPAKINVKLIYSMVSSLFMDKENRSQVVGTE